MNQNIGGVYLQQKKIYNQNERRSDKNKKDIKNNINNYSYSSY